MKCHHQRLSITAIWLVRLSRGPSADCSRLEVQLQLYSLCHLRWSTSDWREAFESQPSAQSSWVGVGDEAAVLHVPTDSGEHPQTTLGGRGWPELELDTLSTGSQCSAEYSRTGEIRLHRWVSVTNRAAAFWIDWRRRIRSSMMPYTELVALVQSNGNT